VVFGAGNLTVGNQFCTTASPAGFEPVPETARIYFIETATTCGRIPSGVQPCAAMVGNECPQSGAASSCYQGTCESDGPHVFSQFFRLTCL
jgi:hypothetical protein